MCPECKHQYQDWTRESINLDLEDFDDEYLDAASSAVCPQCGHKVRFSTMIVRDGIFYMNE